jgi:hypothetical protein
MAQVDSFHTVARASWFLLGSAIFGAGLAYLQESLGFWVVPAIVLVAAATGFIVTASEERSARPAHFHEAAFMRVLPWYGDLWSWALALSMGCFFAAQELSRGRGVTRAAANLIGGVLLCHIVSLIAPRLYPPPNFDRPSILKQSDKPF